MRNALSTIEAAAGQLAAEAADGGAAADAVLDPWGRIESAMSAVIGRRGALALYRRSLELTSVHHPWLAEVRHEIGEFAGLQTAMSRRPAAAAGAANRALLLAFNELAGRLIGVSLTARVLGSADRRLAPGLPARRGDA